MVLMVACTAGLHGCATNGPRMAKQRIPVEKQRHAPDATIACCERSGDMGVSTADSSRLVLSIQSGAARSFPTGQSHYRGPNLGAICGERGAAVKDRDDLRDIIDVPTKIRHLSLCWMRT
jgi:type IV pilus biogenesis protein CpaD/CtpE